MVEKQEGHNLTRQKKFKLSKKYNTKWPLIITFWTLILAISVSIISESIMRNFNVILAFITLVLIILLGILFDIIGIAVAAANEKPFHSMASNRIPEAKYAVKLIRNAGPVSNFCNDVIGDISGIISGSAGTIIVLKLVNEYGIKDGAILSIIMSGIIASFTVGGKAFGKEIAINNSSSIIYFTAKVFMVLEQKLGIKIFPKLKSKRKRKVDG